MGINLKRVLLGGLVAGIVINISAIAMVPVVGKEMDMVLARFNLPPLSNSSLAFFGVVSLIVGMILVWLYAAVLPRMKQGTNTAIMVALVVWVLGYFLANVSMVVYGFMPVKLTVIGTGWGLVELVLASLIGTRFYKEG
jgi:hypothetical protein